MTTAISHEYRGTSMSTADLQTELGVHIVLVSVGLGTLFPRPVIVLEVLRWAGAAYLVWLNIQQWRTAGIIGLSTMVDAQSRSRLSEHAIFVNLANPKNIVFLATLFPRFTLLQKPQLIQYVVFDVATIVVDTIMMIGYATLATRIVGRTKGPKRMKVLSKVFGSLFVLIDALLASARHT